MKEIRAATNNNNNSLKARSVCVRVTVWNLEREIKRGRERE